MCVCHSAHVEVRGKLRELVLFFPTMWVPGHQAWLMGAFTHQGSLLAVIKDIFIYAYLKR